MKISNLLRSIVATVLLVLASLAHAATVNVTVSPNGFFQFQPADVTIQAGDTVQWTWGSSGHSVTSGQPDKADGKFDSGIRNSGATFSQTFATAGTFNYYCVPHGSCCGMVGSVTVKATASPTPTATATPAATATPTPTATPSATATATPTATPSPTPLLPRIVKGFLRIELQQVANGLTAPTDLVSIPDGSHRIVIVQQRGPAVLLKNGSLNAAPFLDLSARLVQFGDPNAVPGPRYDERGFLGIAFHPDFANANAPGFGKLYTFTNEPPTGTADFTEPHTNPFDNQVVVAEWQVSATNPDIVDTSTRREIIRIDHPQFNHNGGQLAFRPGEPYLYISIGDGGQGNDVGDGHNPVTGNGQDTTVVLGKLLRIDPLDPAVNKTNDPISTNGKYRVPASNPFVGSAARGEIYAYGFRNPFRFGFDATTNRLIVADVGQNNIEEVDLVEAGKNYGWNKKEGTFLFNPADGTVTTDPAPDPALTDPVAEYSHADGIAVIGGYVYRGSAIPALVGKYVFGDLSTSFSVAGGRLFYMDDINAKTIFELHIGNNDRALGLFLKAMGRDDAGEIYVLADSSVGPSGTGGVVFKIVQPAAAPALLNLSTRMRVETGDNVLIGGFIVIGSAPKSILLRGIGPSLPVPGTLSDPFLELHDSSGAAVATNDNWQQSPNAQDISSRNLAPSDPRESAILQSVNPGFYTAILRPASGANGVGLVELYDLEQNAAANPVNISTRGIVQTGDNVMIGGFIIGGSNPQRVLIRAIGPSLSKSGIANALQDPTLELHNGDGTLLQSNDNWKSDQQADIQATGIAPSDDRESAILRALSPGPYTAIVRGSGNTSGVALVEAYQLTQ